MLPSLSFSGEINRSPISRRVQIAGFLFLCVLLIGTAGYMYLDDSITWFDALYMTVITVSTIGFSEVVDLSENPAGRLFTIFIAFAGIGTVTYMLSNFAALVIEGELKDNFIIRRMEKKLKKIKGHYLICGVGDVGSYIAEELFKTQRPFVIADIDPERISELQEQFNGVIALAGDCAEDDFLAHLGLDRCAGVFIATGNDNLNLVICLSVRQQRPEIPIIVSCKSTQFVKKLELVGATKVITPESIGGMRMASEMIRPTVTTFLDIMMRDQGLNLRVEEVPLATKYEGDALRSISLQDFPNTLVMAIREADDWVFNPPEGYIFSSRSILIVMTSADERLLLEKRFS